MLTISIENFQSIHNVSFEISGFTVMLGDNDIGKSSTFRSIKSLFNNRSGDGFITYGKTKSQVFCSFEDTVIGWHKEKKVGATYSLLTDGVQHSFEKVGRGTPEFLNSFGFGAVELKSGKTLDPHFSKQREEPFLTSKSGSKALLTEFFSEIFKFGDLSEAITQATKDIKDQNASLLAIQKQQEMQQETLERYPDFNEIDNAIKKIEMLDLEKINLERLLEKLNSYIICSKLDLELPKNVCVLDTLYKRLTNISRILNTLDRYESICFTEIQEVLIDPNKITKLVSLLNSLNRYLLLSDRLDVNLNCTDSFSLSYTQFLKTSIDVIDSEILLGKMEYQIKELDHQLHKSLEDLGVCPLCEIPTRK